jgi:hypothetical protein
MRTALSLFLCVVWACTTTPEDPGCDSPGTLVLEGEVDGVPISATYFTGGYAWSNAMSGNGSVQVYGEAGSLIVDMSFDELLSHGQTSGGTGFLDLSSVGGLQVGNCADDGNVSSVTSYGDGFGFELLNLRRPPYCTGAAAEGSVVGRYCRED